MKEDSIAVVTVRIDNGQIHSCAILRSKLGIGESRSGFESGFRGCMITETDRLPISDSKAEPVAFGVTFSISNDHGSAGIYPQKQDLDPHSRAFSKIRSKSIFLPAGQRFEQGPSLVRRRDQDLVRA